jgi:predicted ATPase/DNA-binding SARP family transcriptional activator
LSRSPYDFVRKGWVVPVDYAILGPVVVRSGDHMVTLAAAKPRALLARLLIDANRPIPAERLIDDLWEGEPPRSALQTLQTYVSQLRKVLGSDRLLTAAGGYQVVVGDAELDAARFEAAVADGRAALTRGDAQSATSLLRAALALWRGPALADAQGAAWAAAETARLEELRLAATETLLEARLAAGDNRGVVASAQAAVTQYPLRERLWALLMTGLYRDGRQADALRAFRRLRSHLGDELGIEPSPELQDLEARMLRQEVETASPVPMAKTPPLPTGVVTFMLTDVVGSTRLWETAPAAMADAISRHEELLRAAVEGNNGVLLKSRGEGDSTFSVFQRATDAVAAALDAHAALASEQWPTPSPVEVRLAVHTGEALERGGDYYGRTVNRAARLRAAAIPGQVLVSQATADLVVDHLPEGFRLQTLGVQQLRDLERPETVFVVAPVGEPVPDVPAASPDTAVIKLPARLAAGPNMGFVGRGREIDSLSMAFKHVAGGSGRVVLIAGEPGIGKTALAAHVARLAHESGATVLFGRCDEETGVPHRPWIEAIGHLVQHLDVDRLRAVGERAASDLARLAPTIGDRLGIAPSPSGDPESDRWSLYSAVVQLLESVTADTPIVLVLDDLQWSDKPSLLLLRHIVDAATSTRLLVLGTYRDSELVADHPFTDVLASLRREPSTERMALKGLADNEVVSLVESMARQALLPEALGVVHAVYRETDGNPFFVEELLRHLAETGAVYIDENGRWTPGAGLDEAGLPDSVREVVGRRVARLGKQCQRVLTVAAVIGQEFDLETVSAAAGLPEDDALDALETAEPAGLVSTIAPGRFAFAHKLVATTLYAGLTPTRRARLHHDIAEAIEATDPRETRTAELARHWAAATAPADRTKAIGYARRAGDAAMTALAPDEALRWYRQALELLEEQGSVDDSERADLLVRLGRAQRNAGDRGYGATLLDACRLARQIGDGPLLARAALANSRGFVTHTDPQMAERVEMLEAALAATREGDSFQRARLLGTLASELRITGDDERCKQLSNEAIAMARRLGNPALLAVVLNLAAYAIWHPHMLTERLALTGEAVELAGALGDRALLHWSAHWRMHALIESGDADGGAHWLDVMERVAGETRQPSLQWTNRAYRSALALLRGDTAEGIRLGEDSLAHAQGVNDIDARVCYSGIVGAVAWQRGTLADDVPRLKADIEAYVREYTRPERSPLTPLVVFSGLSEDAGASDVYRAQLALALIARGEIDDLMSPSGQPWLTAMLPPSRDRYLGWLGRAVLWSEVCERLGSLDDIARMFDALTPFHDQVAAAGAMWFGPAAAALARLALKLGRLDEAERYFAEADEINERIRAPFFLARNRVAWARMLLAGDPQRATDLLRSAIEVARQYDCAGVVEEAEKLLAAPPALPPRLASAVRESFVGRDSERRLIAEALDKGGCAMLVAGEPGIGKSALVAAAADTAHNDGSWIVHGRCDEDLRVPFLPFVDALTQLVAVLPDAVLDRVNERHLAELERIAPNLRDRRSTLGPRRATDPETERYLLMNAVVATLVEAANVAPLVLVIDDLHWADKSTVLLLRHLIESLESITSSHVSVLATYRHTDLVADAPFAEELPRLRSDPAVHHVMLTGLSAREIAELTAVGSQLAKALHRETDGNPFFATELCRHLQETGADPTTASLPHAIRGLIARRVARQGDDVRSTLVAASAIGQEFDLDLLAHLLNQTDDALLDRLEHAEVSALVKTLAPGRFAFAHALIQHALYDEVPPTRRTRLHRQIAAAIEELGDRERRLTELARHWIEAAVTPEEVDRAVGYAAEAADSALEALAPNEAVRWYNQALELLSHQPTSDEPLRCRLLVGLTEAQVRAGDPTFRRTRVQAAELAIRLDDTESLVEVLLKDYTRAFNVSHDPTLSALVEEALQRVGPEVSTARARLLARYGQDFMFSDPDKCDRLADEAVATARQTGDPRTLAAVLTGGIWGGRRAFWNHRAQSSEIIALAEEIDDPGLMVSAYYTFFLWNPGESAELRDRFREVVQLVGRPDFKWTLMVCDAELCLLRGDVAEAERLTHDVYELGRELQQEGLFVIHGALLESVRWHQGRHAEGHEMLVAAAEEEPDLALLRLPVTLAGSTEGEDLVQAVRDLPKDSAWIVAAPILADIIARRDDAAAAAMLYDEMLPYRDQFAWAGPMCRGPVAHSLGVLACATGDVTLAAEHLAEADAINTRMKAPFFQARTWLVWADLLITRGEVDDQPQAQEMLHKALDVARARGYAQIERRAKRALMSFN